MLIPKGIEVILDSLGKGIPSGDMRRCDMTRVVEKIGVPPSKGKDGKMKGGNRQTLIIREVRERPKVSLETVYP